MKALLLPVSIFALAVAVGVHAWMFRPPHYAVTNPGHGLIYRTDVRNGKTVYWFPSIEGWRAVDEPSNAEQFLAARDFKRDEFGGIAVTNH